MFDGGPYGLNFQLFVWVNGNTAIQIVNKTKPQLSRIKKTEMLLHFCQY